MVLELVLGLVLEFRFNHFTVPGYRNLTKIVAIQSSLMFYYSLCEETGLHIVIMPINTKHSDPAQGPNRGDRIWKKSSFRFQQ